MNRIILIVRIYIFIWKLKNINYIFSVIKNTLIFMLLMQLINNKYEIQNIELGSGGFSKVYLGIDIDTGENVAIKKFL